VFGINGGELIVILLVVALVVGPERLPAYAEQLAGWVRSLRRAVTSAKQRVEEEVGDTGVDWEALDPRKYDPRRIVREALLDDPKPAKTRNVPRRVPVAKPAAAAAATEVAPSAPEPAAESLAEVAPEAVPAGSAPAPAPFDDEAT
jgi:sec-independent protein translocase protein TatB